MSWFFPNKNTVLLLWLQFPEFPASIKKGWLGCILPLYVGLLFPSVCPVKIQDPYVLHGTCFILHNKAVYEWWNKFYFLASLLQSLMQFRAEREGLAVGHRDGSRTKEGLQPESSSPIPSPIKFTIIVSCFFCMWKYYYSKWLFYTNHYGFLQRFLKMFML